MIIAGVYHKVQPAIDIDILRDFVGADAEILVYFLGRFFETLRDGMLDMRRMHLLQQWRDTSILAHNLRTSALAIGAFQFAALCEAMEKLAVVPSVNGMTPANDPRVLLFEHIGRAFGDVEKAVSAALPGLGSVSATMPRLARNSDAF
ncbi:hypothetical protein [Glaciimonas immobilis]|uniref:HPt (Histidine-containing phosphotransfer) domain-containing protein n=1 Tax=Glaciimonas immobilis TaxID=728004 RepID=A0A840RLG4_9BURK|nr:hypothetical protein [Glaciimonas immobilis]KAF3998173.1 hypothetical protein HAV38_11580 [Glaciimonas immobilis]MBB5199117.1 HPt (histidine-containing phosphotransfer) domain-containing protein [Glaciimonas immobilis]